MESKQVFPKRYVIPYDHFSAEMKDKAKQLRKSLGSVLIAPPIVLMTKEPFKNLSEEQRAKHENALNHYTHGFFDKNNKLVLLNATGSYLKKLSGKIRDIAGW